MIRSSGEVAGQGAGEGRQNGHSGFINVPYRQEKDSSSCRESMSVKNNGDSH